MKSKFNSPLVNKIENLLKNSGVIVASRAVGGFNKLVKLLEIDLNDLDTIYDLVKNYIHFSDTNPNLKQIFETDDIDIVGIEIRTSVNGNKIINVLFNTTDPSANVESWLMSRLADEMGQFFPFIIKKVYEPSFTSNKIKVIIDATKLKYDNLDNVVNESKKDDKKLSLFIRRRQKEIDELFRSNVKDWEYNICDFNSPKSLMDKLVYDTATDVYLIYFDGLDDTSKEWETIYLSIETFLYQKYFKNLETTFQINCGD